MNKYFPHDCNARSDDKIIALRIRHGWAGFGLYFALIEKLSDSENYAIKADYDLLAYDLRAESSIIESVICDFGLFDFTDDKGYFFSESLNRRLHPLIEKTKRAKNAAKERWNKSDSKSKKVDVKIEKVDVKSKNPDVKINDEKHIKTGENMQMHKESDANAMQMHAVLDADKIREDNIRQDKTKEEIPLLKDKEKLSKDSKKKNENPEQRRAAAVAATNKRKNEFYESLKPYVGQYDKDMLRAFFDYWSEMNKTQTQMRVDKEPTWEVGKRLATWFNRSKFKADGQKNSIANISGNGSGQGGVTFRTDADRKKSERDSLGDLADAILQCSAAKNGT